MAENTPQQSKNAPPARLTCVMCGETNALDATQCEHCGAILQPALDAVSSHDASTRAAAKIAVAPVAKVEANESAPPIAPQSSAQNPSLPGEKQAASVAEKATKSVAPDAAPILADPATTANDAAREIIAATSAAEMRATSATKMGATSSQENTNAALLREEAASEIVAAATRQQTASTRSANAARGVDGTEEIRAQALLDRAFNLAELGDLDAAILACSEAATLQPQSAAPPSMLALLLERAGDSAGAIKAHRRTLRIAPDNRAARDSLARLQAAPENPLSENVIAPPIKAATSREYSQDSGAAQNGDATTGATAASEETKNEKATRPIAPTNSGAPNASAISSANARAATPDSSRAATPPKNSSASKAVSAGVANDAAARAASTRSAADLERATQDDISALSQFLQDISAPSADAPVAAAAASAHKNQHDAAPDRVVARRDSYFLRSLPLAATALLGAWFLWAGGAPKNVASTRVVPATATPTAAPPVAATTETAPSQNQSVQEQLAAAIAAAQAAPKTVAPTATPISNVAPNNVTPTPVATIAASATPTATPILPSANANANAVSPPVNNGGAVPVLPPQNATPAGDSSNFERASQLQQRALAALEAGDNAAAARGFESAIEAYNAQIATGFREGEARTAIAACRDGVRLAQQMQLRAASPR